MAVHWQPRAITPHQTRQVQADWPPLGRKYQSSTREGPAYWGGARGVWLPRTLLNRFLEDATFHLDVYGIAEILECERELDL